MHGGVAGGAAGAEGGSGLRAEGRAEDYDRGYDGDCIKGKAAGRRYKGCAGKIPAKKEFGVRGLYA